MTAILSKLSILFSMLGACVIRDSLAVHHFVWFSLGFTALALYTTNFIHVLESVPGPWVMYVGLGLFPLAWATARLYSILLAGLVDDWQPRLENDKQFVKRFSCHLIYTVQCV